ncbi:MAG: hypothetical protein A3F35_00805 [Candidatus Woykebacteria bacterium RIFCSPHIGHO2_12_FULL_45_10]|uniref:Membrane insertase YidC/Oxa/ALB C-terminal domain-containing protein n=1 Tax=Candidatus Woykebacteria bacterium RIFCSPHIGHO2_12_FULL_45_10 TaxID=1802603 RepID=A0A1G1WQN0_9BACT|nr:MAG: hypothetical protein A3F35_00805 [Candidatus Woykebacteria bacterium RIFCSPHIGHO2_12_FULL_45_10]
MINLLVNLLLALNKILFGNLGLTIIVIGIVSRVITHPFFKSSLRHAQLMRDLKPKLDEVKKKHGQDRAKHYEEQSKVYKEAGTNPLAGCLPTLVQIGVLILLYQVLLQLLKMEVNTSFFYFDLGKPDNYSLEGIPFKVPGLLVASTAIAVLVQSKMSLPASLALHKGEPKKEKEEKADLAEALTASQGQLVFLTPVLFLFWGGIFPAGLFLYYLSSTVVAILQQYYLVGWGSLAEWFIWKKKS